MIAKTALSILALSTSLGIGFASEDVSAGIQKKKTYFNTRKIVSRFLGI